MLVVLGVVLARFGVETSTSDVLDWWVLNVALVAVVLSTMRSIDLTAALVIPVLVAWAVLALGVVVVLAGSKVFSWGEGTKPALLLCVALGNTSFLGFPAIESLLGSEYLPPAIVFDQFGSFLGLATYGALVVARYAGGDAEAPSLKSVAFRLARFAPFVALTVGLASRPLATPEVIDDLLEMVGQTLVPVVMVSIGIRLKLTLSSSNFGALIFGLVIKMIVVPLLILGIAVLFGSGSLEWETSVLEAAMPPMASAGVLAVTAGFNKDLAASLVGYGIVVSMVTLPIWSWAIATVL